VVDAVTDEGEDHHLASVDVHNPQGAVGRHNQVQVEVVDRAVASSVVVVDVVPVLGVGVAPLQGGAEPSDQDLLGKLGGGLLDLEDPWDLARLTLDRSFRQL
jgi:hypothetical protein